MQALANLLSSSNLPGEIILWDDGSAKEFQQVNTSLQRLPNVVYHQQDKNEGRVIARQKLALKANFEYLVGITSEKSIFF